MSRTGEPAHWRTEPTFEQSPIGIAWLDLDGNRPTERVVAYRFSAGFLTRSVWSRCWGAPSAMKIGRPRTGPRCSSIAVGTPLWPDPKLLGQSIELNGKAHTVPSYAEGFQLPL